eukprot:15045128-Ditylum_brightwellii.AAC.1
MARFRADGTMFQYEELAMRRSRGKVLVVVPSQVPLIFYLRKHFEIAVSMSGIELNGLKLISAIDVGIGSSNANDTLDDYDWVGQSRSFVSVMIHNDDRSTDSKGNLLSFEEGSVEVEYFFGGIPYIRGFGCDYGDLPDTIFVDNRSSLDLNECNL